MRQNKDSFDNFPQWCLLLFTRKELGIKDIKVLRQRYKNTIVYRTTNKIQETQKIQDMLPPKGSLSFCSVFSKVSTTSFLTAKYVTEYHTPADLFFFSYAQLTV